MTRDEKFNLLNELLEYEENNDIGNLTRAERREFQQWISEVLEQQPCEDKIIEWKKDFKEYINSLSMSRDDYKGIMEYINELPATPMPKTGHWILADNLFHRYKCSNCGDVIWTDENNNPYMDSPYCCRCGCKMIPSSRK